MTTLNVNGAAFGISATRTNKETAFCKDIIAGLTANSKHLPAKYFYDEAGDHLFQDIMSCQEYYPFFRELEIFQQSAQQMADFITAGEGPFDLIELGAGDCTKSSHLLRTLVDSGTDFTYMPIDISGNIIHYLKTALPRLIPGIQIMGLNGEYFEMLKKAATLSKRRKVVMFLGCNIGNMPPEEALTFCQDMRGLLRPGDMAIIGIDLKKDPTTILAAYNDRHGISKRFNLNLLRRINRELKGNFDLEQFHHFPIYDPGTGACKSYLISRKKQDVMLHTPSGLQTIHFKENEEIYMEISQKYTTEQIIHLARQAGFLPVDMLFDQKKWFVDVIWEVI